MLISRRQLLQGVCLTSVLSCLRCLPDDADSPSQIPQPPDFGAVRNCDLEVATESAIAEIREIGGSAERNENRSGKPVIAVCLEGPRVSDQTLAHVANLTTLERLSLIGAAVSDAGL